MRSQKTIGLMAILFIPLTWACQGDPTGPDPSEAATAARPASGPILGISPDVMYLSVGQEGRFRVESILHRAEAPAPEKIRWISLDPDVAAIASDGTVRALRAGVARILAEAEDLMDTAFVRVLDENTALEGPK